MSTLRLKEALFAAYGGFADLRFKDLNKASRFIVDYRRTAETDTKVYGNSCLIFADVIGARTVRVMLTNSVPRGPAIADWARHRGISMHGGKSLEFTISPDATHDLRALASAFRTIVAHGQRYTVAHYKVLRRFGNDFLGGLVGSSRDKRNL